MCVCVCVCEQATISSNIRKMNIAKFASADIPIFLSLLNEFFPDASTGNDVRPIMEEIIKKQVRHIICSCMCVDVYMHN